MSNVVYFPKPTQPQAVDSPERAIAIDQHNSVHSLNKGLQIMDEIEMVLESHGIAPWGKDANTKDHMMITQAIIACVDRTHGVDNFMHRLTNVLFDQTVQGNFILNTNVQLRKVKKPN